MGTPKQLLAFRGESLLRRTIAAAIEGGCAPVVVVTGANADAVRPELSGLDVWEEWNGEWETGLASSLRAGVERVGGDPSISAAVILLADQPHVGADVVARLIASHLASRAAVVASRYASTAGVPALFVRGLFPELARVSGGSGAKAVIERHAAASVCVDFEEGGIDVDTPDDYARLVASTERVGHRRG